MSTHAEGVKLIAIEKATVEAYRRKSEADFTRYFSPDYIGVDGDGIMGAAEEVAGMKQMDLDSAVVEQEKATFPAPDVGIVTYVIKSKGSMSGKPIDATIYTSTVYVRKGDRWGVVLHTESISPMA